MPTWKLVTYMVARLFSLYPTNSLGAAHGDDVLYLFQATPWIDLIPSETDKQVSKTMVKLWTNFAASGDPNDELDDGWTEALSNAHDDNLYFMINKKSSMKHVHQLKRLQVWEE